MDGDDRDLGRSIDFAWRVHAAQESWTAKVDVKASVLLAAQVGLLILAATVLTADELLNATQDGQLTCLLAIAAGTTAAGVVLVAVGGLYAAMAVMPRLSSSAPEQTDLIYFGHLRQRSNESVKEELAQLSDDSQLDALSRQLVGMSKLNWDKHLQLSVSIDLTLCGAVYLLLGLGNSCGLGLWLS